MSKRPNGRLRRPLQPCELARPRPLISQTAPCPLTSPQFLFTSPPTPTFPSIEAFFPLPIKARCRHVRGSRTRRKSYRHCPAMRAKRKKSELPILTSSLSTTARLSPPAFLVAFDRRFRPLHILEMRFTLCTASLGSLKPTIWG